MSNQQISLPAGYAPAFAIGYADSTGELAIVDSDKPLPVSLALDLPLLIQAVTPDAPAPLTGQAATSGGVGPFAPVAGRPVLIQLSGTWTGTVQIQRSVDAGATLHGLTVGGSPWGSFTGNGCEQVWSEDEAGAELYLDISLASGTVEYRLSQ